MVRELHTRDDMEMIGRWIAGAEEYYLQGFKDSGDVICSGFSAYTKEEMEDLLSAVRPMVPSAQLRGID